MSVVTLLPCTKAYLKVSAICAIVIVLSGCAAGRMFMAGYQPPQTIADLLNEQYALAGEIPPNGITGRAPDEQKRDNKPISSSSYKGQLEAAKNTMGSNTSDIRTAMLASPVRRFTPQFTYKGVQDYAGQLAMNLLKNANGLSPNARIGVTSFVKLDYTLQNTTVLGNQMAEYAISEIQQIGLQVIDFKMMPAIQVTNKGDLAFSRDVLQLANTRVMDHVLSATMIDKADGVFINARIIEMDTNRIVSSASVLVPAFVTQQIYAQHQ